MHLGHYFLEYLFFLFWYVFLRFWPIVTNRYDVGYFGKWVIDTVYSTIYNCTNLFKCLFSGCILLPKLFLYLFKSSFRLTYFFLTSNKSNLKLSHSSMKVSLFSFWLAKKWSDRTFISLWSYTLNSLEVVFVRILSKLNIEKHLKYLDCGNLSSIFYYIAFVYLSSCHAIDCFFY